MPDDRRMDCQVKAQFRLAAQLADRAYPGPVGELLAREIESWELLGQRLGSGALMTQVVEDVLRRSGARTDAA